MNAEKGKRLGRGLEALIPGASRGDAPTPTGEYLRVRIADVRPNPFQPRHDFDPGELGELEASIRSSGLLQPIAVRRAPTGFELISGERRLRAATRLGWTEIPAVIRDADDRTLLTLAMIENLQRANLNAVEEATGYRELIDQFGMTQQQVADAIGKDRSSIAGMLRILSLPTSVLALVEKGTLSTGHARALLPLGDARAIIDVCNETVSRHYSVREVERRVRDRLGKTASAGARPAPDAPGTRPQESQSPSSESAEIRRIEDDLRRRFQTSVRIRMAGASAGTVEFQFFSSEDLDRIAELMLGDQLSRE